MERRPAAGAPGPRCPARPERLRRLRPRGLLRRPGRVRPEHGRLGFLVLAARRADRRRLGAAAQRHVDGDDPRPELGRPAMARPPRPLCTLVGRRLAAPRRRRRPPVPGRLRPSRRLRRDGAGASRQERHGDHPRLRVRDRPREHRHPGPDLDLRRVRAPCSRCSSPTSAGPPRRVFLVFPLLALWANLHGSVVVGAALVSLSGLTLALTGIRTRSRGRLWWRAGALIVLPWPCILVSPYGLALPGYYRSVLDNPTLSQSVAEWAEAWRCAGACLIFVAPTRRSLARNPVAVVIDAVRAARSLALRPARAARGAQHRLVRARGGGGAAGRTRRGLATLERTAAEANQPRARRRRRRRRPDLAGGTRQPRKQLVGARLSTGRARRRREGRRSRIAPSSASSRTSATPTGSSSGILPCGAGSPTTSASSSCRQGHSRRSSPSEASTATTGRQSRVATGCSCSTRPGTAAPSRSSRRCTERRCSTATATSSSSGAHEPSIARSSPRPRRPSRRAELVGRRRGERTTARERSGGRASRSGTGPGPTAGRRRP